MPAAISAILCADRIPLPTGATAATSFASGRDASSRCTNPNYSFANSKGRASHPSAIAAEHRIRGDKRLQSTLDGLGIQSLQLKICQIATMML